MVANMYIKKIIAVFAMLIIALQVTAQVVPTITGPPNIPAGISQFQYSTEPGMTNYVWTVSGAGNIILGAGTDMVTVEWTNPTMHQTITVTYAESLVTEPTAMVLIYYPFPDPIDPFSIPQFVDPMPHFAGGLRVNAKAGGNLVVRNTMVQQAALSTGTVCANGTIGTTPGAGMGNYAAYSVSTDGGLNFGPAMWPAQTIEAQQGNQLIVEYRNELYGVTYADFNILADQSLMMNGYTLTGNVKTDPYSGPIPMSVHLHGGEMPSNSDGGPLAWFMPGTSGPGVLQGPGFAHEASTICTYPNMQEGTTLWYHPHDQGLTRINVYTGLAGYYFLRGANEDALHLPGWSGDGTVLEVTPTGKSTTFYPVTAYKPEVELAIQDRMFNVNGALYWPVAPTNPGVNPFWTPEFVGDVMTVNGKSWPYLSVAPRKYMFRMLDGCNARFLSLWLSSDPNTGVMDGPRMTVLSTEGGMLATPVVFDPALGQKLVLAPAERPMVVIDFTGYPAGTVFYLMNDASAPYPFGDPVIVGLTDRIMQFVVNGTVVTPDASVVPVDLRPASPMVKLTNFDGTLNTTPTVKRQLFLNEIMGPGGPLRVAINNSHFDELPPEDGQQMVFGGPTEIPTEGTTEMWQIANLTADAHPIHPHLVQWQLVSRQAISIDAFMADYSAAWAAHVPPVANFPFGATYPGGAGSPFPYNVPNADGALGGNPAFSTYLFGPVIPANPEEMGWKDAIKSMPGFVETYMVRMAPTEKPLNAAPVDMVFPFDPSLGPGYVYHCHIIDHEDMDMMRALMVNPSPLRFPTLTAQPAPVTVCSGWPTTFAVTATSLNPLSYQWESSTDGITWIPLTNVAPYSTVTTATLNINPVPVTLTGTQYRCVVTTTAGAVTSTPATLTVTPGVAPTLTGPIAVCEGTMMNVYTTEIGMTNYTWAFSPGTVIQAGGTIIDNTATIKWNNPGAHTVSVNYTNLNGCTAPAPILLNVTVNPKPVPIITGPATVLLGGTASYSTDPGMTLYTWTTTGSGVTITGGQGTSTATFLFSKQGNKKVNVTYTNPAGCVPAAPTSFNVTVSKIKDLTAEGEFINTTGELKFEVYPVPNDGHFSAVITSPEEETYTIQVYNSIGVRLYEKQDIKVIGSARTEIDIRPSPPGLYSVVFLNSQNQFVRKVLISR